MKKIRIFAALALLSVTMGITRAVEQNQVWNGSLVDVSCYATDHEQSGDDHMGMRACGKACLKMGRPAGILTTDKKLFVLLAPSPDLAGYVGQTIRVTGKLRDGSILVDKFEVKTADGWVTLKLNAMM